MNKASDKLIKKGFNIGDECYIFFNGKIVKSKIIEGDYILADDFLYPTDSIRSFVLVKIDDSEDIGGWHNESAININQLYKTYDEAERNKKYIVSVKEFVDGYENVCKDNVLARIKLKTQKEYTKLKSCIDESYIINDNENHVFESIDVFPCVVIVIEENSGI